MQKNISEICTLLADTDNSQDVYRLLSGIFTVAELNDLDSRWEILKRLTRGDSQRSIAKELHLGLCKITRGSKELKKPDSILSEIFKPPTNR